MTGIPELDARPHGAAHPWAAWASRIVLAVLFAVGMLGSAARPLTEAEGEPEPVVEIGEDGEPIAREDDLVRIVRRCASHGGPWWAPKRTHHPQPPRRLDPTVRAPTAPRWQRPRRAPPPGDDDGIVIG